MEKVKYEIKARVSKKLFYNADSMFGVYSFDPVENCEEIEINKWGNFVVNGNTPELFVGKQYEIVIEDSEHPKYGKGYSFVAVKQKKPTTVQEQQAYIRAMLKDSQAEAIIKKYPNEKILDLMKEDKFDYSDIKGIAQKTYDKIKKFLFDHLDIQEALVELQDLNITFKAMSKLINHFGDARVVVQKIKENIYNLCEVNTFGFLKVDQYALNRGDDKTNSNRIIACIKYVIDEEANNGNSWCDIGAVVSKAKELLQIDITYIQKIIELLKEDKDNTEGLYFEDNKIALYKYYYYEREITKKLKKMLEHDNVIHVSNVESKINKLENDKGFTFTDEQKHAIKLANDKNILVINGKGGTGKTFTLQGILDILNRYSYMCCALSGKAAKVITNNGLEAMTIHRMLGVNGDGKFRFNQKDRLPYDIIVIDEASMINTYLFYSLLVAIKDSGKLIILGDHGQLAAIGVGSVFEDILNSKILPQQELTIVQRQAQKSGILSSANIIRDGNQINGRYNYEKQVYGELKDFVLIPVQNRENIKDIVLEICRNYKHQDMSEFQVITAMKSRGDISVKKLNIELQKIFNDINKPFIKRGGYEYRIGDKIIQCGNNYSAGETGELSVFNGTLGQIVDIEIKDSGNKIMIQFEGMDEIITYEKDELDMIELAYATTVHRSQGSTIKHVLFTFDYGAYTLLSKELIYTGVTRASKACVAVCENSALHHAISVSHAGTRRTFLKDMLLSD